MKKNKMMRIASVLLIVTILSTCAISGTFAKYITKGTGEGEAQVAKWGINIYMKGDDLFSDTYDWSAGSDVNSQVRPRGKAVKAAYDVVAPGTSSEEAGGNFEAVIKGTPEVAVRYSLGFDNFTDIVLHAGDTIKNETVLATTYDATTGEFTYEDYPVAAEYSPVKFTIKFVGTIAGTPTTYEFPAMSLTDWDNYVVSGDQIPAISYNGVYAYADNGALNFDVPAGKSIEGSFFCTWAWDFDNNGAGTYDIYDTYLGNHTDDYSLSFEFTATAVQID